MKRIVVTLVTLLAVTASGAARAADTIDGTPGPDKIPGTPGADVITAKAGDDVVHAKAGDDLVLGGPGADTIHGQRGSDELRGDAGADVVDAGRDPQKDYVIGGGGNDKLYLRGRDNGYGGPGDDRVWSTYAQAGAKVRCGGGHDVLIFNQPSPAVVRYGCEVVKIVSAG